MDWERFDALTEEEIIARAVTDRTTRLSAKRTSSA